MVVFVSRKIAIPPRIPAGTQWLFTEDGTFTPPVTGRYQIEMHGGGGSAASETEYSETLMQGYGACASGGGSGEIYEQSLTKDESITVTIGAGGSGTYYDGAARLLGNNGGTTTFGSLSIEGGKGGIVTFGGLVDEEIIGTLQAYGGQAVGSLATGGRGAEYDYGGIYGWDNTPELTGGHGNRNNTAQTYGDGGVASKLGSGVGQPGAVIVTFLGR